MLHDDAEGKEKTNPKHSNNPPLFTAEDAEPARHCPLKETSMTGESCSVAKFTCS
jgi:hypothetical protein